MSKVAQFHLFYLYQNVPKVYISFLLDDILPGEDVIGVVVVGSAVVGSR